MVELGRYGQRRARSPRRSSTCKPNLAAYARVSYFRELHGDLRGALRAMRLAAPRGRRGPESAAYVQTLLGKLSCRPATAAARPPRAERCTSSRATPAAGTRWPGWRPPGRLRRCDPRACGRWSTRLPLPEYVIALGETELAAGQRGRRARRLRLVGAERGLCSAAGVDTDVELALFEADHGEPRARRRLGRRAWATAPSVRSRRRARLGADARGDPRAGLRWARRAHAAAAGAIRCSSTTRDDRTRPAGRSAPRGAG